MQLKQDPVPGLNAISLALHQKISDAQSMYSLVTQLDAVTFALHPKNQSCLNCKGSSTRALCYQFYPASISVAQLTCILETGLDAVAFSLHPKNECCLSCMGSFSKAWF